MATTTQINSRIELAVTKAEKTQEAYLKVLSSEGQQDIKLSDGTFTPNLNKRLVELVARVKSVAGKTGDVTAQDIKDSLSLGSAADYDVNDLPVPQGVDGRIQTAIDNLNLGSASQKDVEFFNTKRIDNSNVLYQKLLANLNVTHSSSLAFMQGVCSWGDYIFVSRHINRTGPGNTDQCEIIQFENKGGIITQIAVTPVLPIGHGQDLGVREKDGKLYIYSSSSYNPNNISATLNRCVCRIEWKGANTTVSDLKYIELYSKLNRLSGRQYNTYTGATSEDGSKYIISVAVSNSAKRDILVFNTDDLDNFDSLTEIKPVVSFTQPLLTSTGNSAIQGVSANNEFIVVTYGASYLSRYVAQIIDYQGNLLKEIDVGSLKNSIASAINNPNGANYVAILENEGVYVKDGKVYLAFEADVRNSGDVVTYGGTNYTPTATSSKGVIPDGTDVGWLVTDMPVNKGEWNADTTYTAGTLVERVRAIYEVSSKNSLGATLLTVQASPQSYASQYLPNSYYNTAYDENTTYRLGRWNEATRTHKTSYAVDNTGKHLFSDTNTDSDESVRMMLTTTSRPKTNRYFGMMALSGGGAPYVNIYGVNDVSASAGSFTVFNASGSVIARFNNDDVLFSKPLNTLLNKNGSGSPEGVVSARVGAEYVNTDTGATYRKISGTGSTGWTTHNNLGEKIDLSDVLMVSNFTYWADASLSVNVASSLYSRQYQLDNRQVIMSYASNDTGFFDLDDTKLNFPKTSDLAKSSFVFWRNKSDFKKRSRLELNVTSVPNGDNSEIKVLCIGDSNVWLSGASLIKQLLLERNYASAMKGTFQGGSIVYKGVNMTGKFGEARNGMGITSMTYETTSLFKPVDDAGAAAGDAGVITVAAYKALSNSAKENYSPMLRKATVSDDQKLVRNGYIFDFKDYLTKMSVDVPDVIYFCFGVNEISSLPSAEAKQKFIDSADIIFSNIRKDYPNIKIIVGHNAPSSMDIKDNEYWNSYTAPIFAAKRDLAIKYNLIMLNTHLIDIGETSMKMQNTTINQYGLQVGEWVDGIHFYGATRIKYYDYVAANIAAAFKNLI